MALTVESIHKAADELQGQGIKPTLAEVRKVLGGGSFTTISDAMKTWREEHKDEQQLKQVDLPSGIDERLQALGADMWQKAIDIANDRLVKEREALEVIKAKSQQDVDESSESVKILEAEQKELLAQLDEVTATAETATSNAKKAENESNVLKQALSDTEHKLELERTKADTALAQLTQVRNDLDSKSAELTASLSDSAKLEAKAENSKEEIKRLKEEIKTVQAELKATIVDRDKIKDTTAEYKGELKAITAERDKLAASNDQLTKSFAKLEAENQALDKSRSDLMTKYTKEKDDKILLKQELQELKNEIKKLPQKKN